MGSAFVRLFATGEFPQISSLIVLDALTYAGDLSRIDSVLGNNITFIRGEIQDSDLVLNLMKQVDVCVNYAAETHVDNSILNPRPFIETNILGTEILLEAAKLCGISRFVQISTDEVYGAIEEGEWTEESSLDPSSPYSASKLSGDLLVKAFYKTYKLPIVITRSSNNFGPYQNKEKFIPKIISRVLKAEEIPVYGNGQNIREWLFVYDHAKSTYLAITKGRLGEVYNIGSGIRCTNLELVAKIIQLMDGSKSQIKLVEDRLGHDFRYALNSQKSHSQLGFKHTIDLNSGLLQIIKQNNLPIFE